MEKSLKHTSHPLLRTISMLAFIFIIGLVAATYVYFSLVRMEQRMVENLAVSFSGLVSADTIAALSGSSDDLQNPVYLKLKSFLMHLHQRNENLRFIYLMGQTSGNVFFYADSEDPSSPDYSPPGQSYPEASPGVFAAFATNKPSEDAYPDRWGNWISGYAPIRNASGAVVAVLGVDVSSDQYTAQILGYASIPIFIAFFFMIVWSTFTMVSSDGIGVLKKKKTAESEEDRIYRELKERLGKGREE